MDDLDKLEKLRADKGISRCDLARRAELSDNTIYNWYNSRKCEPTVTALRKVCSVLNITLSAFFADESKGELTADKVKLLNLWGRLDEDDKKSILQMMNSLVKKQ